MTAQDDLHSDMMKTIADSHFGPVLFCVSSLIEPGKIRFFDGKFKIPRNSVANRRN